MKDTNPLLGEEHVFQSILTNPEIIHLNAELDDLIFELYELTDFERSLIKDRCKFTIEYYYKSEGSIGSQEIGNLQYLDDYINAFKSYWQRKLEENETFSHIYITSKDQTMIGIAFELSQTKAVNNGKVAQINISEFHQLMEKEISRNVFTEGLFRRVTENDQVIIIKKNRKDNWTKTEAKVDADATFLQIFKTPADGTTD